MRELKDFRFIAENSLEYAASLKQNKKKIICGYLCSYTPEEIIHAAGIHPIRLFGKGGNCNLADAHIQSFCCSLVKDLLEDALSGNFKLLDGVVFPSTCDTMRRLSDIWRINVPISFHADIPLPAKIGTENSLQYTVELFKKFKEGLEKHFNRKIDEQMLGNSISLFNSIRRSLNKFSDMLAEKPGIVTGSDYYSIIKAAMIMDREELDTKLKILLDNLEQKESTTDENNGKRLILSGSVCDHEGIYKLVEKTGGTIVADDLCNGSRYFEGINANEREPLIAIANRYNERIICPAKHSGLDDRAKNLLKTAGKTRAQGVVFVLLKFCDPHAFDYPYIKEILDENRIPSTLIEIEQGALSEGQLETRLLAFMEMLG